MEFNGFKVIINADDFGYSKAINAGIIDANINGIITSTTAMCNMPYIEDGVIRAKECCNMDIGLHLNITCGRPILNSHKTIVNKNGVFISRKEILKNDIDIKEVADEFEAQLKRFISLFNKLPSHIDGHHNIQALDKTKQVVKQLASFYDLPVRELMDDVYVYYDFWYENNIIDILNEAVLKTNVNNKKICEIMTHPGFLDEYIYENSSSSISRIYEHSMLTSEIVKEYLKKNKVIKLSRYSEI